MLQPVVSARAPGCVHLVHMQGSTPLPWHEGQGRSEAAGGCRGRGGGVRQRRVARGGGGAAALMTQNHRWRIAARARAHQCAPTRCAPPTPLAPRRCPHLLIALQEPQAAEEGGARRCQARELGARARCCHRCPAHCEGVATAGGNARSPHAAGGCCERCGRSAQCGGARQTGAHAGRCARHGACTRGYWDQGLAVWGAEGAGESDPGLWRVAGRSNLSLSRRASGVLT